MRLRASSSITVASLVSSLGGSSGGGRCREEAAFQPRVEEEKLRKRKKVKALSVVSSLEGRNTEWKSQSEVMKNV